MLKWLLTLVVAIFLLGIVSPHLARFIRFGRLPGDLVWDWRGRSYRFPFTTTLVWCFLFWLISRIL